MPFVPPWKVPSIMKASTCIVCPESEETPFLPKGTHGPQIAREAMAVGKPVIIGKGVKEKGIYLKTTENHNILVVDSTSKGDFANILKFLINNKEKSAEIGKNARKFAEANEDFDNYIKLPDILTLGAMKAFALGRRAKWKDYVDLYFIFQKYSFKDLVDKTNSIFKSEFNEKLFRTQLGYFEDIDHSEEIKYIQGFEKKDEDIKQFLEKISLS